MAMSKEEAKIKRLEKQIELLKDTIKGNHVTIRRMESENRLERQWRMDFQRLMKEVVHSDNIDDDWI